MRALLLLLAITIAVVFCEVGTLDHVSDCFICMDVLSTAMMVRVFKLDVQPNKGVRAEETDLQPYCG
ncbi:hypothetical protein ANCCAN_18177 [Ancylostoma caninum]|uniref:Uncharacterized protein n=1 Tax=Ancylostoma caninum TaxID=29170 RepID=A0A368FWT8_ANCCA|nr:hypothetical protein ANCCAN_18177 [Ancylostoma caninum]